MYLSQQCAVCTFIGWSVCVCHLATITSLSVFCWIHFENMAILWLRSSDLFGIWYTVVAGSAVLLVSQTKLMMMILWMLVMLTLMTMKLTMLLMLMMMTWVDVILLDNGQLSPDLLVASSGTILAYRENFLHGIHTPHYTFLWWCYWTSYTLRWHDEMKWITIV